jgi:hypothetical protein
MEIPKFHKNICRSLLFLAQLRLSQSHVFLSELFFLSEKSEIIF